MKKKILMLSMLVLAAALLVVSCDNGTKEPAEYTVTFDSNGGTAVASQAVKEGEKVAKPANPTHTGWGFLRWSATKDGTTAFDFDKETVTGDITLYAVWKTSYKVGETGPAGGIIFYDCDEDDTESDPNGADDLTSATCGWRYLEVAPTDLSQKYIFGLYKVDGADSSVGTSAAVGKGKENTDALIAAMGAKAPGREDSETHAAQACADYGNGTDYDDWFLPSSSELHKIYENVKQKGLGGTWDTGEYTDYYWSSTDINGTPNLYAYTVHINTGAEDSEYRYDAYNVRPARRF